MRAIFNAPPALRLAFNRRASHHATNQESFGSLGLWLSSQASAVGSYSQIALTLETSLRLPT